MLDKIARQTRIVETSARNAMTGNMADLSGWPGSEGEDAMGVNIGDHIHYHQTATEPAATQPPAAVAGDNSQSLLSKALPYLLAVATGVGGYYFAQQPSPTQPPATVSADKDAYGIELQHYIPESPP